MAIRNWVIVVAAVCTLLGIIPAIAENVPLPMPAPLPKTGVTPPRPTSPAGPTNTAPAASSQGNSFFPFTLPFGNSSQSDASAFDEKQRNLLDRISLYLSNMRTLVGSFVQIGPDGRRTNGTFYIQKPGKVRFAYNPPSPIDVIADGSYVVVRNRDLDMQENPWRLSQTPLRYLLADHIDLLHDAKLVSVSANDKFATVVIEENQVVVGTSRLMIMFDAKDLKLKQWTITDPQGLKTTVAVFNLDPTKKPSPDLFIINYQNGQGITNH
jgi:outer membrane lipoprotein-sorting protein